MRRWFELAAFAVGLAALALLCWQFGFSDLAAALRQLSPRYLVIYLGFGMAARLGYAVRWRLVARTLGSAPALPRFIAARLAGDATASLLPALRIGGDPLRAGLVCGDGVSGAQAGAGVAIDRIIELISNMLCGAVYVTVFSLARAAGAGGAEHVLVATMGALLVSVVVPLVLMRRGIRPLAPLYRLPMGARVGRWMSAVQRTEAHVMRLFQDRPAIFVQGVVGSLAIEALIICEYHFLMEAFGLQLHLPTLLMTLVASGLSRVVPTPAGLGALEAGQVTVLGAATGHPDLGFVVGFVLRLHETLWTGVGLIGLSLCGFNLARLRGALAARGLSS